MIFTTNNKKNIVVKPPPTVNNVLLMGTTPSSLPPATHVRAIPKYGSKMANQTTITKEREYKPNQYDSNNPKPMKWGEPTWFFFHTIAEKVKEESFPIIREELLDLCFAVCINLPCSICANHAKEYMTKVNYLSVKSKEELKNLFYTFHNTVNARKNYQMFPRELLDEKYASANTVNIIRNFVLHFQEKYHIMRLMSDQMQRMRISERLKKWFNENIQHFNV